MTMKTVRRLTAAVMAVSATLAMAPLADAQGLYSIRKLGACAPAGLNETPRVVGGCGAGSALGETAFVWENGVTRSLGKLPDANYSIAHAVNARGIAVGEGDTGDFRPHPTLYRNGRVIDIDDSVANGRAIYINDRGVIVGNRLKGGSGVSGWSPVIWRERRDRPGRFDRVLLAPYPGGDAAARYGYATAANQRLQVVGYVQSSLFGQRGAFWDSDGSHTLTLLLPLPDDWTSYAWGVNDLGQAVGESHRGFRGSRAAMWLDDANHTPVDLGTLPGDVASVATAINTQGQIIGLSTAADGSSRPVLWQNGTVAEIGSLLDATGADWVIESVVAINDAGEIVGTGRYRGRSRSFLMTPIGN
jgi:probable HAF family extracellular repeat protein